MPIKIKLPPEITSPGEKVEKRPVQASISLKIKKTLDGNLLIDDHEYMDIVIVPSGNRIITMPKPYAEKESFQYQKEFMYNLFKSGVLVLGSTEGGLKFGVLEAQYPEEGEVNTLQSLLYRVEKYIKESSSAEVFADEYDENIEDRFVEPSDEESTKYGEIPPYEETPEGATNADPTYSYYGYGYLY